jgi:hypothetical protein
MYFSISMKYKNGRLLNKKHMTRQCQKQLKSYLKKQAMVIKNVYFSCVIVSSDGPSFSMTSARLPNIESTSFFRRAFLCQAYGQQVKSQDSSW